MMASGTITVHLADSEEFRRLAFAAAQIISAITHLLDAPESACWSIAIERAQLRELRAALEALETRP